jgi:hypothetical protein
MLTLASVALVGLAAFFAGGWWNSQPMATQNSQADWERIARDLEQSVHADSERRWETLQGSVERRLSQFESALAAVRDASRASGDHWQQVESALVRLADHQAVLRTELETLAVSAETAILSAKRDIRNLNQLAMSLGGIHP